MNIQHDGDSQPNNTASAIATNISHKDGEPNKTPTYYGGKASTSTLWITICTGELCMFQVAVPPWSATG